MTYEQLKLSNQLCFPVYAASRLITREYQPFLDHLGITYPQYLVLLVLWETDGISVNEIAHKLILNTNTITPLLKRMEVQQLLTRQRAQSDERKVLIHLTEKGKHLQADAATIPEKLMQELKTDAITLEDVTALRNTLNALIESLSGKQKE